jgi:hypothetical protein
MSKRAGVRRFGVPFVAAFTVVMALVLSFGTAAKAAACTTTPATTAALQAAVAAGNPGDVICLNANQQYSPTATLDVNRNLTIETDPAQLGGAGRAGIISGGVMTGSSAIDSGQLDVLAVASGVTLTLSNVVETQAIQPSNGGVVVTSGGTALIDHSLLSGNTGNAVDVKSGGQATITNSTLAGSIQGFDGVLLGGSATLNYDTIANNSGNGIDKTAAAAGAVNNTILSNNALGNCNSSAGLTGSNDGDSGTTCGATITTGGFTNVSAGLVALANNGGPTNTLALTAASPAIGHGLAAPALADDQRGFLRSAPQDIGAFQLNGTQPATLVVIKHVVGPGSPSNFQITVTGAGANPSTFPGQDTPGTSVSVQSGQTYQIGETMVGGGAVTNYTLGTSGNCTGPIAAGATGTCTLTNTAKPFNLLVTKSVNNSGGGTGTPADFTMTVTDTTNPAASPAPFPGSTVGTTVQIPAGDSYTVAESADAAQSGKYTPSNSGACSGVAAINGSGTCGFTNTFITCPQTGLGPNQSNTCVNATVNATIVVTSPSLISFPALGAGETSSPVAVPVNVKSNNGTGYQLSCTRTAFTNGDIPLSISGGAVSAPQAYIAPLPALTPIPVGSSAGATLSTPPTGPNLNLGTDSTFTSVAGDNWPFSFTLGPVPFGIVAGTHQSVVTFTAVTT